MLKRSAGAAGIGRVNGAQRYNVWDTSLAVPRCRQAPGPMSPSLLRMSGSVPQTPSQSQPTSLHHRRQGALKRVRVAEACLKPGSEADTAPPAVNKSALAVPGAGNEADEKDKDGDNEDDDENDDRNHTHDDNAHVDDFSLVVPMPPDTPENPELGSCGVIGTSDAATSADTAVDNKSYKPAHSHREQKVNFRPWAPKSQWCHALPPLPLVSLQSVL